MKTNNLYIYLFIQIIFQINLTLNRIVLVTELLLYFQCEALFFISDNMISTQ